MLWRYMVKDVRVIEVKKSAFESNDSCLLYTSDAADEFHKV